MIVSSILALDESNLIGKGDELPWHLPGDLKRFKAITMGKPVIMGRRTYESIGKPLPGRLNIVVSRTLREEPEGCELVHSVSAAIMVCREMHVDECFVIGGAQIYKAIVPDRLYLTRVEGTHEGDVFFHPNLQGYQLISEEPGEGCSYFLWERCTGSKR